MLSIAFYFLSMALLVVFVCLIFWLIQSFFMTAVAKRLILRQTAETNPNGFFLQFYLKRAIRSF
ncbi:MAG: hypothetical protein A2117_00380 [Candidatus Wildermuthbacteria bacterium GWA2_46_15]|uniref:Uncharacterized protein n=1 Tax=Candidatus Wildermuthbacteria bacterium GWA2_46_15 TaxID=1802443 RepID=A0A1G2QQP0_9BACT|nr:MAG: hypothetical protein A2117_00380 [Candidatus Wildermuthbacteria bacterium GWA2_46_15]